MLAVQPARAFFIETPVTASCHEDITLNAVARAGFFDRTAAPAPTEDQRRAMDDLTFSLPHKDVWTMAVLFGVRSNDIRNFSPEDVTRIGTVHNDPADQPAHCMRRREDDGPNGDLGALAACRAFILAELETAGLLGETLDLTTSEQVPVYLAIRGSIPIQLPRFAYRLGRALHAGDGETWAEAWNFGPDPDDAVSVRELVDRMMAAWPRLRTRIAPQANAPHEAHLLRLDNGKARQRLGWAPALTLPETVELTVAWYRAVTEDPGCAHTMVHRQLHDYEARVRAAGQVA